jgi:hypothetical protein
MSGDNPLYTEVHMFKQMELKAPVLTAEEKRQCASVRRSPAGRARHRSQGFEDVRI